VFIQVSVLNHFDKFQPSEPTIERNNLVAMSQPLTERQTLAIMLCPVV
jgi:hypothetical protein